MYTLTYIHIHTYTHTHMYTHIACIQTHIHTYKCTHTTYAFAPPNMRLIRVSNVFPNNVKAKKKKARTKDSDALDRFIKSK